jgi:hypothetical protein
MFLIPQAEHTARSYPFEILANLTLPAALGATWARACRRKGGVGMQRLGCKGDASSSVEAQGGAGLQR